MAELKTVFSYYGGKAALAKWYPEPMYPVIVEPFAGSAAYSQRYWKHKVFLFDVDPDIVETWRFLISASETDILSLPDVSIGTDIHSLQIPQGAKNLIGYAVNEGSSYPKRTPNVRAINRGWWNTRKHKVARLVSRFNHWEVRLLSWENLYDIACDLTWFIDPPYSHGGKYYRYANIRYGALAAFCKSRHGQTIVCENTKANWLGFTPLIKTVGMRHTHTTEAIWHNIVSVANTALLARVYTKRLRVVTVKGERQ